MSKEITPDQIVKALGKRKMDMLELAKKLDCVECYANGAIRRAVWLAAGSGIVEFDKNWNISAR